MLVASKIKPICHNSPSFFETFGKYAIKSDFIRISTGYVSISSLLLLDRNIRDGKLPEIELTIGMHAFEGFTKPQFEAARTLAMTLDKKRAGNVFICTAFPYHGKLYSFFAGGLPHHALVGSSNLSRLDPDSGRTFEVDVVLDAPSLLTDISKLQVEINEKATKRLLEWNPNTFKETGSFMAGVPGVEQITKQQLTEILERRTQLSFSLPLKDELKSNLNVYFAKGRLNTNTGLERPRPWYEVEVIVSV